MSKFGIDNPAPRAEGADAADAAAQGSNPRPTRAPLQDRSSVPRNTQASGMEGAMSAMADKLHPRKSR